MKRYAAAIDADFVVVDEQGDHSLPHFAKLDLARLLNEYDRICYVDSDVIIRPDSPDIFREVPIEAVGACDEAEFAPDRRITFREFCVIMDCPVNEKEGYTLPYFNTGVMVFSRCHKGIFIQPSREIRSYYEQTYLNFLFYITRTTMYRLTYMYNRTVVINMALGGDMLCGYFNHYAGYKDMLGFEMACLAIRSDADRLLSIVS
jgi:lipopolysaccharide biosynthesis glycosyltransferase